MMKVNVIAVGKIKEKYLKDGIEEFAKRLKKFCNLQVIEVGDEPIKDKMSEFELQSILKSEGERIIKNIPKETFLVVLDRKGKLMSSEVLAQKIQNEMLEGRSSITFIIGGTLGLDKKVLERADLLLSLSSMTFTHQLTRLIIMEQIYRCFKILANEKYHR